MKKYLSKDYLDYAILAVGIVLVLLARPLNIVVNHYMHTLALPLGLVVACYGIYVVVKRTTEIKSWYKWVAVGVSTLCVVIWGLGLNQQSKLAYLGSGRFVVRSVNDDKQVVIADRVNIGEVDEDGGVQYLVYFNPNCQTCQDTIPEVLKHIKGKDRAKIATRVAFIDTTQDYGKSLAQKYGVEYVPSYMYNKEAGDVVRLAYHTDNGTKLNQMEIGRLQSAIRLGR